MARMMIVALSCCLVAWVMETVTRMIIVWEISFVAPTTALLQITSGTMVMIAVKEVIG